MIYEFAGVVGVGPGTFTLKELEWMAAGKLRAEWGQTKMILATMVKMWSTKGGPSPEEMDFNPLKEAGLGADSDMQKKQEKDQTRSIAEARSFFERFGNVTNEGGH